LLGNNVVLIIAVVSVVLFSGFVVYMSWKKRTIMASLRHMKMSGMSFILGPEISSYRGATSRYGRVKCDGVLALTEKTLIFLPYIGNKKEIPLRELRDVEITDKFLGQYRAGAEVLVLHGNDFSIGFFVQDGNRWLSAIVMLIKRSKEVV
jgi:hypothetical protein